MSAHLKVRIFVLVNTRRHKHGPALHLPSVQLQGFIDWHQGFKLYIAVAFEAPFVAEDGANLFDRTTGIKQRPELRLRLLQSVRQVTDEHAGVVIAELWFVVILPLDRGFFVARGRRLESGRSVLPSQSSLCLHVLIGGVVTVSPVPFSSLICHREVEKKHIMNKIPHSSREWRCISQI